MHVTACLELAEDDSLTSSFCHGATAVKWDRECQPLKDIILNSYGVLFC